MDKTKLISHVSLCKRNLRNPRVNCCALCPFEDDICAEYPEMRKLFYQKQQALIKANDTRPSID